MRLTTFTYEDYLPVVDYSWDQDEADMRNRVNRLLADAGYPLTCTTAAEFVEWDSPNPTHANGCYNVTVQCPLELLPWVKAYLNQE